MNRYIKSLFITSIIYTTIIASFIYSNSLELTDKEQSSPKETPLKISIIQFQEPKPIIKQPEKKEPIKKVEPIKKKIEKQKIVKKDPIKKPKPKPIERKTTKIVKKTIEPVQEKIKEVVKKEVREETKPQASLITKAQKVEKKPTKQTIKTIPNKEQIEQQKKEYFSKIKQTIDKNKNYPKLAVRRGIEGLIKIKFTLSHTGELLSYNIIEGQRVFKKSVIKAIQQSFPLVPPQNLFTSNIDLSLTLAYKLY